MFSFALIRQSSRLSHSSAIYKRPTVVNASVGTLVLGFLLLFPAFPTVISNEIHINIMAILFAFFGLIFLGSVRVNNRSIFLLLTYFFLQGLLALSWGFDVIEGRAHFSDILSSLRPLFLCILVLFFAGFFGSNYQKGVQVFSTFCSIFVVLCFLFVVLESQLAGFDKVSYFLYKQESRDILENAGISFFHTTYFAGYVYLFMFLLFGFKALLGRSLFDGFMFLLSFLLLIWAQSKVYYVLIVIGIIFILFFCLQARAFYKFFTLIFLSTLGLVLFYFYGLYDLLKETNRTFLTLSVLLESPEASGSLGVRVNQVLFAFQESYDNFLLGAGLGRGTSLESYLSNFTYRYGFLGLVIYFILFCSVAFTSISQAPRTMSAENRGLNLAIGIWFLMMPVSLLSSPMIETGKTAVFSCAVLGMWVASWKR